MLILSRKKFLQLSALSCGAGFAATAFPNWNRAFPKGQAFLLHQWYQTHYHPLNDHFFPEEKEYVHSCLKEQDRWSVPLTKTLNLSLTSYSLRFKDNEMNSGRFAIGRFKVDKTHQQQLNTIFLKRNIKHLLTDFPHINGIGWDFSEEHFKAYSYLAHQSQLPTSFAHLIPKKGLPPTEPFLLIARTFHQNKAQEDKVYLYPKGKREAWMFSSLRGLIIQQDVKKEDSLKINLAGTKAIDEFSQQGWPLDTIAYKDPSNYTLYF